MLIRLLVLRDLSHHRVRTGLTVIGVALGVTVYVAMRIANLESLRSFEQSALAVSGRAALEVVGGERGFDEAILPRIANAPGVLAATPVMEVPVLLLGPNQEVIDSLLVLGVDLFDREIFWNDTADFGETDVDSLLAPGAVVISERLADRHQLEGGDSLTFLADTEAYSVIVRGLLAANAGHDHGARERIDALAVMDIAAAQETFGRIGTLDRIGVAIEPEKDAAAVRQALQRILPHGLSVQSSSARSEQVSRLTQSFRVNLTVLSGVALLVGLFLVYNTVTFSVIQRRREIGILRSLGMDRRLVMTLILIQALCIGALGGLLGIGLGLVMAKGVLTAVSATMTALYVPVSVSSIRVPPSVAPQGMAVALLVSMLATIGPIRAAGRLLPARALAPRDVDITRKVRPSSTAVWGVLFILLGYGATTMGPVLGIPIFGYFAMLCVLLGCACLMPTALSCVRLGARCAGHRSRAMTWGMLAATRLAQNAGRSSMTMSALMVGLAITIGVAMMIHSFRHTVRDWIEQTLMADVIVAPTTWVLHGTTGLAGTYGTAGNAGGRMSEDLIARVIEVQGVEAADGYRELKAAYQGSPIAIVGRDLLLHAERSRYLFMNGHSFTILNAAANDGQVLVSEAFFRKFGTGRGDSVELSTPSGPAEFLIAGVFYDYATDGGKIVMDRSMLAKHWQDRSINVLACYLEPGADVDAVSHRIREQIGRTHHLTLISNRELKERIFKIFDQTFRVTYALEFIAVLVALLGIANALLASVLERRREWAIIRSLGGSPGHIRRILLWEASYLGLIGAAFGAAAGTALGFLLIRVVNMQSFGWSIHMEFPIALIAGAVGLGIVAAILAGVVPARLASKQTIAGELQYE